MFGSQRQRVGCNHRPQNIKELSDRRSHFTDGETEALRGNGISRDCAASTKHAAGQDAKAAPPVPAGLPPALLKPPPQLGDTGEPSAIPCMGSAGSLMRPPKPLAPLCRHCRLPTLSPPRLGRRPRGHVREMVASGQASAKRAGKPTATSMHSWGWGCPSKAPRAAPGAGGGGRRSPQTGQGNN